jgi:hypothetical protein
MIIIRLFVIVIPSALRLLWSTTAHGTGAIFGSRCLGGDGWKLSGRANPYRVKWAVTFTCQHDAALGHYCLPWGFFCWIFFKFLFVCPGVGHSYWGCSRAPLQEARRANVGEGVRGQRETGPSQLGCRRHSGGERRKLQGRVI